MPKRNEVGVFVSYARRNGALARGFMEKFKQEVGPSRYYDYFIFEDSNILPGEYWEEEIELALEESDLGLLLVSPAFLWSLFIAEQELPVLLGSKNKVVVPITLAAIDLERHDLRGLEDLQIFRLESDKFKSPKSYRECVGFQRDRFVHELFKQVEKRLDTFWGRKKD